MTAARSIWFEAARRPALRIEEAARPAENEVTIRAQASLISPGTEMQVYRGEISADTDLGLATCRGSFGFPVKYAYQVVGTVEDAGPNAPFAVGDLVFARHPHQDVFTMECVPELLFGLPAGMDPEVASFANLADVALNAMLDQPTRVGDVVVVFGHGIVGTLCAQLARRTAGSLIVVDPVQSRRAHAIANGADTAVAPEDAVDAVMAASAGRGADVAVEVSGSPLALQQAIDSTGQEGTIVVVSYYGSRTVSVRLSPEFHFRRHRIISSQVSSVGSGLQPRWDFQRRLGVVLDLLPAFGVERMITHRFALSDAVDAYGLIDQSPAETLGVVIDYRSPGTATADNPS